MNDIILINTSTTFNNKKYYKLKILTNFNNRIYKGNVLKN